MELDSIQDCVVSNGSRMSGTSAKRLSITFSRSANIRRADGVERHRFDCIDVNEDVADRVHAADPHAWPLPQAKGDGDAACNDLATELSTEFHRATLSRLRS
jgi:hypothetical protein